MKASAKANAKVEISVFMSVTPYAWFASGGPTLQGVAEATGKAPTHRHSNVVVAFPSFRVPAVDATGSDRMEEMQSRLEGLEQFSDEYENLTQLFADTHLLTMDAEGRIILPETLKEHAQIDADVAFVGLGATFQMWEPGHYAEHRAAVRERSRQQGTTLPASGAARRPS